MRYDTHVRIPHLLAVGALVFIGLWSLIALSKRVPQAGAPTPSVHRETTSSSVSPHPRDDATAGSAEAVEAAPGLLSAGERIVAAWPGNADVDNYRAALDDAWRFGPLEFSPRARHAALYAPCTLVAPDQLPAKAGHSVEWQGPLDAEWRVTRGLGEHIGDCALDVAQKPDAIRAVELSGRRDLKSEL